MTWRENGGKAASDKPKQKYDALIGRARRPAAPLPSLLLEICSFFTTADIDLDQESVKWAKMASRPIKIKTGVLNRSAPPRSSCSVLQLTSMSGLRLVKEERTYRDEAEAQKRTLDAYIAQGKDEWDIKNAVRS